MGRIEEAAVLFGKGANCAQSVLRAFAGDFAMDGETAMRVATGFGAGMGRMAGVCGAVTGAFMALGLARGMRSPEEQEIKNAAYALVREFTRRFSSRNSSILCKDILGLDIGTEEGMKAAKERNLFTTRCADCVKDAVRIVSDILAEKD